MEGLNPYDYDHGYGYGDDYGYEDDYGYGHDVGYDDYYWAISEQLDSHAQITRAGIDTFQRRIQRKNFAWMNQIVSEFS